MEGVNTLQTILQGYSHWMLVQYPFSAELPWLIRQCTLSVNSVQEHGTQKIDKCPWWDLNQKLFGKHPWPLNYNLCKFGFWWMIFHFIDFHKWMKCWSFWYRITCTGWPGIYQYRWHHLYPLKQSSSSTWLLAINFYNNSPKSGTFWPTLYIIRNVFVIMILKLSIGMNSYL